jgi:hypothetical protein
MCVIATLLCFTRLFVDYLRIFTHRRHERTDGGMLALTHASLTPPG